MGVGVLGVNSVSDDELLRARYGDAEANEDTDGSMEEDFDAIVDFESVGAADAIDWAESVLGRPHSSPPMDGGDEGGAAPTEEGEGQRNGHNDSSGSCPTVAAQ